MISSTAAYTANENEYAIRDIVSISALMCLAMVILLIGTPAHDPRLVLSGLPLVPILYVVCAAIVFSIPAMYREVLPVALMLLPIALLAITLFWSPRPDYGAGKIFDTLAVVIVVVPVFAVCIRQLGQVNFCRLWIVLMFVLLLLTVLYKLRYGFLDRQVLFLMNGPIVFARLMGIAALMSIFALKGVARYALFLVFFLAVVWTMSKGPILAVVVATGFSVAFLMRPGERIRFAVTMALIVASLPVFAWEELSQIDWGRLGALWRIVAGDFSGEPVDFQSSGIRLAMYRETLAMIFERPFGVGIGGWSVAIHESYGMDYVHNIFLEFWSEGGLIIGTLALLPYIVFVLHGSKPFRAVAIFLLAAQMVSGDLLDARYLLVFSLLAVLADDFGNSVASRERVLPFHGRKS